MFTENQQARRSNEEFSRNVGHKDGSIDLRSWEVLQRFQEELREQMQCKKFQTYFLQ